MTSSTKLFFDGPAGKLEGLWRSGGHPDNFQKATILCHPHPVYGGTMENKIVARCARDISGGGIETLRFNFRGAGQSDGAFDSGRGERDDLRAAIDFVLGKSPQARLAIVGFSFGAWIGLEVGRSHPSVDVLVAIAPPVRMFEFPPLEASSRRKLVVYAGRDQYTAPEATRKWIEGLAPPVESYFVPDVDHFFDNRVDEVAAKVAAFVSSAL
jgi:hypothetical protein